MAELKMVKIKNQEQFSQWLGKFQQVINLQIKNYTLMDQRLNEQIKRKEVPMDEGDTAARSYPKKIQALKSANEELRLIKSPLSLQRIASELDNRTGDLGSGNPLKMALGKVLENKKYNEELRGEAKVEAQGVREAKREAAIQARAAKTPTARFAGVTTAPKPTAASEETPGVKTTTRR